MVDTDDTRQTIDDRRQTTAYAHKLPSGELLKDFIYYLHVYVRVHMIPIFFHGRTCTIRICDGPSLSEPKVGVPETNQPTKPF